MVFVSKIGFSILGTEDDVIKELLMGAWHFTLLSVSPLRGFRGDDNAYRCLTAPARVVLALRACCELLIFTFKT